MGFHDVTEKMKEKLNKNQFAWLKRVEKEESRQFPKVFLVDQPGIGGQKVSAQGYMDKFAPGHYDFTMVATATRLMENEYFLMMHLQKFERPYIILRTKVDSDVTSNVKNKKKAGDDKYIQEIQRVKEEFLKTDVRNLNSKGVYFLGKSFRAEKTGTEFDFNEDFSKVEECLVQSIVDAMNMK